MTTSAIVLPIGNIGGQMGFFVLLPNCERKETQEYGKLVENICKHSVPDSSSTSSVVTDASSTPSVVTDASSTSSVVPDSSSTPSVAPDASSTSSVVTDASSTSSVVTDASSTSSVVTDASSPIGYVLLNNHDKDNVSKKQPKRQHKKQEPLKIVSYKKQPKIPKIPVIKTPSNAKGLEQPTEDFPMLKRKSQDGTMSSSSSSPASSSASLASSVPSTSSSASLASSVPSTSSSASSTSSSRVQAVTKKTRLAGCTFVVDGSQCCMPTSNSWFCCMHTCLRCGNGKIADAAMCTLCALKKQLVDRHSESASACSICMCNFLSDHAPPLQTIARVITGSSASRFVCDSCHRVAVRAREENGKSFSQKTKMTVTYGGHNYKGFASDFLEVMKNARDQFL